MTPEGRVKEKVKGVLRAHGAYWHCPVQNGMGAPSLDFVGCFHGKFFAIETKAGCKPMTDRQANTAESMRSAGAAVFLVNEETGTSELDRWFKDH